MEINQRIPSALGSFNNYVDKKRWIAYQVASRKSTLFHITYESANFVVVQYLCKMSTIVQSMGWSKSGKLWSTQLQNDPSPRRSASDPRFGIQHVFPLNYEAERITQVNQSNTYSRDIQPCCSWESNNFSIFCNTILKPFQRYVKKIEKLPCNV